MKKFYLIIVAIMFYFQAFSQFSLKAEIEYLKIVNSDGNKFLIKNNLFDAEIVADTLIYMYGDQNESASVFFQNLAESYFLIKKYDLALYTAERQRLLYPSDDLDLTSAIIIKKCLTKLHLQQKEDLYLNATTYDTVVKMSEGKRLTLLFQLASLLYSKKLKNHLTKIVDVYTKKFGNKLPYDMAKWLVVKDCKMHCIKKYYTEQDIMNNSKDFKFSDLDITKE